MCDVESEMWDKKVFPGTGLALANAQITRLEFQSARGANRREPNLFDRINRMDRM